MSDGIYKTIVLTGAGSWTVPSDWNNEYNVIHIMNASTTNSGILGSVGGNYARVVNLSMTPGQTAWYSSGTSSGALSWFSKTSNATPATTSDGVSITVNQVAFNGGAVNGSSGSGAAGPAGNGGASAENTSSPGVADGGAGGANGGAGAQLLDGNPGAAGIITGGAEPLSFGGAGGAPGRVGLNQGGIGGEQGAGIDFGGNGRGGSTYWIDSNNVTWYAGAAPRSGSGRVTDYQDVRSSGGMVIIQYVPIMSRKTIFLTSSGTTSSTWTVPADWNNTNNFIAAIGGGGNGGGSTVHRGGGGGAYSRTNNINLTVGATTWWVAPPSAVSGEGQDAWFNKASNAAPATTTNGVLAKGGRTGGAGGNGIGGAAASGVGDVKYNGGNAGINCDREGAVGGGGTGNSQDAGGGGAAGPNGPGGTGANAARFQGGGGGAADSSTQNGNSGNNAGTNASVGGTNFFGIGAGLNSNATNAATAGQTGFGAGGGAGVSTGINGNGANGSTSIIWNQTVAHSTGTTTTLNAKAGPGGGGGGAYRVSTGGTTGSGANYGGGGAGVVSGATNGGLGGGALIVISWLVQSASGGNMFLMFH